ncbi:3-dehydroquinate synthase [Halalkalibacillus sediminis]|uniref:3-dehydroquinate synthase n=1 Tax=Halalkalibacillus sediminis TaxID=2018042 RepID=A0A2I0QWX7_9BACI|nr:3-dehydroquinate synthase [Halalkalibacillus sediminis]PKR78847.1 3-dehydroquinate synthase [Halalkalibacillus sediminis]
MNTISVSSKERNYQIHVGKDIRHQSGGFLKEFSYSKVAIITDENVAKLYLDDVRKSLEPYFEVEELIVPAGELSKSLHQFEEIQSKLIEKGFDRHSALIALGGGMIGDLVGFVASTYMRGIGFIQMPTTLLAHDSSIGGKVAINFDGTKNLIGQFYSPELVIYDVDTFNTLNDRELRSGFAEMVKHGFIESKDFLTTIKNDMSESINFKDKEFINILAESILIKKRYVQTDEYEKSIRRYLNLGHTWGHAIEASSKDSELRHGECVMMGMLFALYLSDQMNGQENQLFNDSIIAWIRKLNFQLIPRESKLDEWLYQMQRDKKNSEHNISFVLLESIGKPYSMNLDSDVVRRHLESYLKLMKDEVV